MSLPYHIFHGDIEERPEHLTFGGYSRLTARFRKYRLQKFGMEKEKKSAKGKGHSLCRWGTFRA